MNNTSEIFDSASRMMPELRGNCAQAVFATYGLHMGLGKIDFDTCMKIASAFGGGINLTGNVCGAITGSLMALGIKYGGSPHESEITEISTQFLDEFISINGSILCRELIDRDLITEEDLKKPIESDIFKKCMKYVDDAARLLNKHIE
ncbi:MAG: C-GCAxxG-C-C family protein [Candidatus Thorarchaeota archaeon]